MFREVWTAPARSAPRGRSAALWSNARSTRTWNHAPLRGVLDSTRIGSTEARCEHEITLERAVLPGYLSRLVPTLCAHNRDAKIRRSLRPATKGSCSHRAWGRPKSRSKKLSFSGILSSHMRLGVRTLNAMFKEVWTARAQRAARSSHYGATPDKLDLESRSIAWCAQ